MACPILQLRPVMTIHPCIEFYTNAMNTNNSHLRGVCYVLATSLSYVPYIYVIISSSEEGKPECPQNLYLITPQFDKS